VQEKKHLQQKTIFSSLQETYQSKIDAMRIIFHNHETVLSLQY